MANSSNNTGYNTYISGIANNIISCTQIIVYLKSSISGISEISLYNVSEVYAQVIESGKYTTLNRATSNDPFYYNPSSLEDGFDMILYLSNVATGTVVGYTRFLNSQGECSNITLNLDFEINIISDDIDINLVNSVAALARSSSNTTNSIGDEDYQYVTVSEAVEEVNKVSHNFYTTSVENISRNPLRSGILLTNGSIKGSTLHQLKVLNNIDIDSYELGFENHQVGFYGSQLVVYSWEGLKYSIHSLSETNRFGNVLLLTPSGTGYWEITDSDSEIDYFSGHYAVMVSGKIWNIFEANWAADSGVVDIWSANPVITKNPSTSSFQNLIAVFPEITNVHIDLEALSTNYAISVRKRIGQWWVIDQSLGTIGSPRVIYTTSTKSYTTLASENEPVFLNNEILVLSKDSETITFLQGTGNFESPELNENFEDYIDTNEVTRVAIGDNLRGSLLYGFKKSGESKIIPNPVAMFRGLIFYKEETNLKYM